MSDYTPIKEVEDARQTLEDALRNYVQLKYQGEKGMLVQWITGYAVMDADGNYHTDYCTSVPVSPHGVVGLLVITEDNFRSDLQERSDDGE